MSNLCFCLHEVDVLVQCLSFTQGWPLGLHEETRNAIVDTTFFVWEHGAQLSSAWFVSAILGRAYFFLNFLQSQKKTTCMGLQSDTTFTETKRTGTQTQNHNTKKTKVEIYIEGKDLFFKKHPIHSCIWKCMLINLEHTESFWTLHLATSLMCKSYSMLARSQLLSSTDSRGYCS